MLVEGFFCLHQVTTALPQLCLQQVALLPATVVSVSSGDVLVLMT